MNSRTTMFVGLIIGTLTAASIVATGTLSTSPAYADANCDHADREDNVQGNRRGNVKQCTIEENDGPKEPIRKCFTPNGFKDNDGDGNGACRLQGSNQ
jgi:hypothetical protein